MTTMLAPAEKANQTLLATMRKATRAIAKAAQAEAKRIALESVLSVYRLSTQVKGMVEDEATHGRDGVEQLAQALGRSAENLYDLRNFAEAFDSKYVAKMAAVPMANNRFFTVEHWVLLARVKDAETRAKLISRTRYECLTPRDLKREIRVMLLPEAI